VGGGVLRLVGVGLIATVLGYLWLVLFSDARGGATADLRG